MHILAAGDAALPGLESTQEGFQFVVGAWQPGDFVAGEQAPPPVAESLDDMARYLLVPGIATGCLDSLQPIQIGLDLLGYERTAGWWLSRIQQAVQIDQPLPLADQLVTLGLA